MKVVVPDTGRPVASPLHTALLLANDKDPPIIVKQHLSSHIPRSGKVTKESELHYEYSCACHQLGFTVMELLTFSQI
jgi:hypothetical protein